MEVIIIEVLEIEKLKNEIGRKDRIKIRIEGDIEEKGIERKILINRGRELNRIIDERRIGRVKKRLKKGIGIESIGLRIEKIVKERIDELGIGIVVERIGKESINKKGKGVKGNRRKIVGKDEVKRNEMGFKKMIGNMENKKERLRVNKEKVKGSDERRFNIGNERGEIIVEMIKEIIESLINEVIVERIFSLVGKEMKIGSIVVKNGKIEVIVIIGNVIEWENEMIVVEEEGEECVKKLEIGKGRVGSERWNNKKEVLGIDIRGRNDEKGIEMENKKIEEIEKEIVWKRDEMIGIGRVIKIKEGDMIKINEEIGIGLRERRIKEEIDMLEEGRMDESKGRKKKENDIGERCKENREKRKKEKEEK